jgi:hypothetical protein
MPPVIEKIENEKEPLHKIFWGWLVRQQFITYLVVSLLAFGFQWMRQSEIERKLADAERNAIHRAETNYSILISGMLQTSTIMETNLIEERNHKVLLINCARKNNCSDDLLVEKQQKPYVPVAQHYFNVKQQMENESREGDK